MCTSPPLVTVASPAAVKVTARPELARALTVKSGSPQVWSASGPKLMVWSAELMVKLCGTSAAGASVASPAWCAVMVALPAPRM